MQKHLGYRTQSFERPLILFLHLIFQPSTFWAGVDVILWACGVVPVSKHAIAPVLDDDHCLAATVICQKWTCAQLCTTPNPYTPSQPDFSTLSLIFFKSFHFFVSKPFRLPPPNLFCEKADDRFPTRLKNTSFLLIELWTKCIPGVFCSCLFCYLFISNSLFTVSGHSVKNLDRCPCCILLKMVLIVFFCLPPSSANSFLLPPTSNFQKSSHQLTCRSGPPEIVQRAPNYLNLFI